MKDNNNGVNSLAVGLLILGVVLIIGLLAGNGDSSVSTCSKPGCDNVRASGSSYCYIHKPYTGSGTTSKTYNTGSGSDSNSESSRSSTTSSYSSHTTTGNTSGRTTKTYNTLNNDPADYDDPEEYADDAWGDDFDDWDEAYDYWEDY